MSGDDHLIRPDHDAPDDDRASQAFAACIVLLGSARRYLTDRDARWLDHYDSVLKEATEAFYEIGGTLIKSEGEK